MDYLVEYFYANDVNSGESVEYTEEEIVEYLSEEDFAELEVQGSIKIYPPANDDVWEDIEYYTITAI